jgi:hypothetical protein
VLAYEYTHNCKVHVPICSTAGASQTTRSTVAGIVAIRECREALYRGDAKLDLRRRGDDTTVAVLDLPLEQRERLESP